MLLKNQGFTVLELVLALGLLAVVMAGVGRVMLTQKRLYRELGQRADLSDNLRTAGDILSAELWGLDAADGDILALGADSIRIRAERAFSGVCGLPTSPLRLRRDLTFGVRDFAVGDSLLVYSSPDSAWRTDVVTSTPIRVSCPDSVTTPVRAFEVVTYRSYRASDGAYYIGMRDAGGLQPIAGPLVAAGLLFSFFDSSGSPTGVPRAVAAIRVRIRMQSAEPVTRRGVTTPLVDSTVRWVSLRNN
ncbi:MAG TPA: hypothetical protein VH113_00620 [Gemmatimonadales bacterium]|jgi:hypothetical protein|nr:hypothetical protein [Gemmatimonadales bacterium]